MTILDITFQISKTDLHMPYALQYFGKFLHHVVSTSSFTRMASTLLLPCFSFLTAFLTMSFKCCSKEGNELYPNKLWAIENALQKSLY
jgi:hypothetical protein